MSDESVNDIILAKYLLVMAYPRRKLDLSKMSEDDIQELLSYSNENSKME